MNYPNATHFSAHFSRRELECGCGCDAPPDVERNLAALAVNLEALRAAAGRPLLVNCAYRCPARNALVGGAPASFHMQGRAADIDCSRAGGKREVNRLATIAEGLAPFKNCGVGRYYESKGLFVHVDTGNRKWRGIDGK